MGPSAARTAVVVPGLTVLEEYVTEEEQALLLKLALAQKPVTRPEWLCGSPYEHVCVTCPRIPNLDMYVILQSICARLKRDTLITRMPGTLTINYYEPGEGLRPHIDNQVVIAELVIGISLGSTCTMDFAHASDASRRCAVLLTPGTVVIQQGEARYEWTHGIAPGAVTGPRVSVQLSDFDPRFFSSDLVQERRLDRTQGRSKVRDESAWTSAPSSLPVEAKRSASLGTLTASYESVEVD
jgi:alkylated DNA repair dioxygenase AlkB